MHRSYPIFSCVKQRSGEDCRCLALFEFLDIRVSEINVVREPKGVNRLVTKFSSLMLPGLAHLSETDLSVVALAKTNGLGV